MKNAVELLSSGATIQLRPVPPYVIGDVWASLPEPEFPEVKLESRAGAEIKPVLPGTPEWGTYRTQLAKWRKISSLAVSDFILQYGVVRWKWPGEKSKWVYEAPEDWGIPNIMFDLGFSQEKRHQFDNKRLWYIKHELILTEEDMQLVMDITNASSPITGDEVRASEAPFES